jgi:hypothetical protein
MQTILVTDVTEMSGSMICVAGWNRAEHRMIRPLNIGGRNWPAKMAIRSAFWPGSIMRFRAIGRKPRSAFPHATEDRVVLPGSLVFEAGRSPSRAPIVPDEALSPTIAALFGSALRFRIFQGVRYHAIVSAGAQTVSLGCIELPPASLRCFEKAGDPPQLRATLHDTDAQYDLPVVAHDLKACYRESGLAALAARLQGTHVQVRLGLSRPWGGSDECFVMVNGVYPC